jgi:hypothetical protein
VFKHLKEGGVKRNKRLCEGGRCIIKDTMGVVRNNGLKFHRSIEHHPL